MGVMALNITSTTYYVFNPVAPTIPKWRAFKLLRWVQLLNRLVDLGEMEVMSLNIVYYKVMYGK
jgi:hypothetical protein